MPRRFNAFLCGRLFCLLLLWLVPAVSAADLKETWYLYRGRENMEIKNYKAAIEAYENAVRINPDNKEAARGLGLAYEHQGVSDKAVGQYDSYLKKFPDDGEIALRQARLLKWSRYSYRQGDAVKYYRMAIKSNSSAEVRLEYAEVLAANKETSGEAVREFHAVLAKDPRHARAHRGLAKAYAWQGNQDQALHHAQLARQYGDSEVRQLENSISKDRRPEWGVDIWYMNQSSSQEFDLSGIRLGAFAKRDVTPFMTLNGRAGAESFWNKDQDSSGSYIGVGGEYRLSMVQSLMMEVLYHSMADVEGQVEWRRQGEAYDVKAGFERELIYDSYLSLVGVEVADNEIGAARKNSLYGGISTRLGPSELSLKPYFGWVSASSVSKNSLMGVDFSLKWPLSEDSAWALIAETKVMRFDRDHTGFGLSNTEPLPGGYFSPSSFFSQNALIHYARGAEADGLLEIQAGPTFQQVRDTSASGSQGGGQLLTSYLASPSSDIFVKGQLEIQKLGDIYTRTLITAWFIWRL